MRKIQRHIKQSIKKIARFFDSDKRIDKIFISEDFLSIVKPYSRRLMNEDYIVSDDEKTFSVAWQTTKYDLHAFSNQSEQQKIGFHELICHYHDEFPESTELLFHLRHSVTAKAQKNISSIIKNADLLIVNDAQHSLIFSVIENYFHYKLDERVAIQINALLYLTDNKGSKAGKVLAYDVFNGNFRSARLGDNEMANYPFSKETIFDTCVIQATKEIEGNGVSLWKRLNGEIVISANGKIYHYKIIDNYSFYCVYSECDEISITVNDVTVTANSEGVRELKTIMEMLAY